QHSPQRRVREGVQRDARPQSGLLLDRRLRRHALIYEALNKTNGNTDAEALITAAKGLKWDSPRGPMSIDPDTRDVVQTIYIRRVEKVGGELVNVPFDKIENVKDPTRARGG